jgi:putative membrane protein
MRGMEQRPTDDGGLADSAPRRTWLAAERTYLAWLRTGLGALGLALAVGRLLPALVDADHTAFGLLGAGYGVLGVFVLVLGAYRAQRIRAALAAGRQLPTDFWEIWALTVYSIALAVATIVLVLAEV